MSSGALQNREMRNDDNVVDDRGNSQKEAIAILRNLRDHGFASSNEQLATALGRSAGQVKGWLEGIEQVDDDVVMRARGIAQARDVRIESDDEND
jgi:hypothetical protein